MARLEKLIYMKKSELDELARGIQLEGYSTLSKSALICALADRPVSEEEREIVDASSSWLYDRCKELDVPNFSSLSKAQMQEKLLRQAGGAPSESTPTADLGEDEYVYAFEIGGTEYYCRASDYPGIATFAIFNEEVHSLDDLRGSGSSYRSRIFEEPPGGSVVKEPPQ